MEGNFGEYLPVGDFPCFLVVGWEGPLGQSHRHVTSAVADWLGDFQWQKVLLQRHLEVDLQLSLERILIVFVPPAGAPSLLLVTADWLRPPSAVRIGQWDLVAVVTGHDGGAQGKVPFWVCPSPQWRSAPQWEPAAWEGEGTTVKLPFSSASGYVVEGKWSGLEHCVSAEQPRYSLLLGRGCRLL